LNVVAKVPQDKAKEKRASIVSKDKREKKKIIKGK
jgi:hypothetical protein